MDGNNLKIIEHNSISKNELISLAEYEEALLIRKVEEKLLDLFSLGKINGTVHTCIGQEFSALAFAGQLKPGDFVFSNHRCHGHFISFTKNYYGLLAELMGKKTGVCGGVGSSQHLYQNGFYSNGIQGGIVPVAAGMALAKKIKKTENIGVVYIGDGTLGEGIVYETLNIISKWNVPLLVVCENNRYAQSTPIDSTLAGSITNRAKAFAIEVDQGTTEMPSELMNKAKLAISKVRNKMRPFFFLVDTYRLMAHSKGDDNRDEKEVTSFAERDPLNCFREKNKQEYNILSEKIDALIDKAVEKIKDDNVLSIDDYIKKNEENLQVDKLEWGQLNDFGDRQIKLINDCFKKEMEGNKQVIFIGEDVKSPYGGAFKASKDLSDLFPDRVFSTPISEAAIIGISNGMALAGLRPIAEIMFGDFITLCLDQIINHTSKFQYMYNHQVSCPIIIRTPMGGRRGYGPTHSQTLDRFLIGIDAVKTIALNPFLDPQIIYQEIFQDETNPVIVIENKTDYSRKLSPPRVLNYKCEKSNTKFPIIKISPRKSKADLTLVTYGGLGTLVAECIGPLFLKHDFKIDFFCLTQISPVPKHDLNEVILSSEKTSNVFFIEEGQSAGAVSGYLLLMMKENSHQHFQYYAISGFNCPIPSVKKLEDIVLPGQERIINFICEKMK